MNIREWLDDFLAEESAVVWDGCDAAVLGIGSRCAQKDVVVYDYQKLLRVFMDQGMDEDEAAEWISFNLLGAWVGETTPIILFTPQDE